jgi:hypothetical protein
MGSCISKPPLTYRIVCTQILQKVDALGESPCASINNRQLLILLLEFRIICMHEIMHYLMPRLQRYRGYGKHPPFTDNIDIDVAMRIICHQLAISDHVIRQRYRDQFVELAKILRFHGLYNVPFDETSDAIRCLADYRFLKRMSATTEKLLRVLKKLT